MLLRFDMLAVMTASAFSFIAVIWMLAPARFLTAWGVDDSAATRLVGRRAAALYAGVAVMLFFGRNAAQSPVRAALVYGLISSCLLLALLGVYELFKGRASKGILAAVLIELALSLLFIQVI
ncbi:hypothetical protein [Methylophilus aquaticus]|uniref:DUF4345 domain-containing protein n=1 Tax=Methylophilus aquaticus TaxID=1971610 RepID=A0ABT9JSQ7_9PROT|nr:hypothetical protein [Methylophilus aquaticus]MDP8567161.1 hypothetical protein [Methylophilus aquaticus]